MPRTKFVQHAHHPSAHIAIEVVVAAEHGHTVLLEYILNLVDRASHLDAQRFGFVAAGNDATIVIAQNHDGLVAEVGVEHPFARSIKIIAVDDGIHGLLFTVYGYSKR